MLSKRANTVLFTGSILCVLMWIFLFLSNSNNSNLLLPDIIESIPFGSVLLEKDTTSDGSLPSKDLQNSEAETVNNSATKSAHTSSRYTPTPTTETNKEDIKNDIYEKEKAAVIPIEKLPKGKELKASNFPLMDQLSSRVRITTMLNTFKHGDYISGVEFSNLYRRDPSLSKVVKSTLCGFIEKNVDQITRVGNSLVIHTIDPNGIHTKIKIPFVEDLRINIENGASMDIGETFSSKEPNFKKSILLPITLHLFDISHNGEQFPTAGYISGNFYFIDYSSSKMAYKLR